MSMVDMLVNVALGNKDISFTSAWKSVTDERPSSEEMKEFNEQVFKCDNCGRWCSVAEENMVVDLAICDPCFTKGAHRIFV